MGPITKLHQSLYNADLPPITLKHVDLSLPTSSTIFNLTTTLNEGTRLGVAASYGKKCVLEALALSTASRILVITMNDALGMLGRPKQILRSELLCDLSFEKHGFFWKPRCGIISGPRPLHPERVRRHFSRRQTGIDGFIQERLGPTR